MTNDKPMRDIRISRFSIIGANPKLGSYTPDPSMQWCLLDTKTEKVIAYGAEYGLMELLGSAIDSYGDSVKAEEAAKREQIAREAEDMMEGRELLEPKQ